MDKEELALLLAVGFLIVGIAFLDSVKIPAPATHIEPQSEVKLPVIPPTNQVTGFVYVYNPNAQAVGHVEVIGG